MTTQDSHTGEIRMTYRLDEEGMLEMMTRAGRAILSGAGLLRINVVMVILIVLLLFGGVAMGHVLLDLIGNPDGTQTRVWLPFVMGILAAALLIVWQASSFAAIAGASVKSRFNTGEQTMTATPNGIVLQTPTGRWETSWTGVEAVLLGKTAIGFVVSGIVLPVPRTALSEEEFDQISRWHTDAS